MQQQNAYIGDNKIPNQNSYEMNSFIPSNVNTYQRSQENDSDSEHQKIEIIKKYQEEILNLKKHNENMKKENKALEAELEQQKIKQQKAEICDMMINDLSRILNLQNTSEIVPKINNYKQIIKANEKVQPAKDEFIQKLYDLYLQITGNPRKYEGDNIDLEMLIKWIKSLLNTLTQLTKKHPDQDGLYKDFCEELMKHYHLKSLTELRNFVSEHLQQ